MRCSQQFIAEEMFLHRMQWKFRMAVDDLYLGAKDLGSALLNQALCLIRLRSQH